MKKSIFLYLISLLFPFITIAQNYQVPDYNELKTPYLGQKAPGMIPELFAPFITTKADHKHSAPVFSPDGKEMFYSFYKNREHPQRIYHSIFKNGKWTEPQETFYSGKYQMGGPVISPDGKKVYFYCKKPIKGKEQRKNGIVWYSEKKNNNWGDLKLLHYDYNDTLMYLPSYITKDNELYMTIGVNGKSSVVYKGKIKDNKLYNLQKLNGNINKVGLDNSLAVLSPDQSTMIIWRFNRKDFSKMGLCMSVKDENGEWSEARFMGDMINIGSSRFPGFSSDGKYFFFTNSRSGREEIYWVNAKIIDYLKTEDLNLTDRVFKVSKTKNKNQFKEYYELLKQKYHKYYIFDGKLLNRVADKHLKENNTKKGIELIIQSIHLYPDNQPITQNLLLSILENDPVLYLDEFKKLEVKSNEENNNIELQINRLGYKLIGMKDYEGALKIFFMNTDFFPKSANAFDSLGEAFMLAGNKEKAIKNFQKSLELNPENKNAKNMLEKLNKK